MLTPPPQAQPNVFLDRRIISIFVLGIVSGLPWVMIGSALTLWLKDAGISRTDIGYAGLITFVYAINCLWSPVLDAVIPKTPFKMGPRRSWILLCQIVVASACLVMSTLSAQHSASLVVLTGFAIALASATQDIAIDAYRVDQFERHQSAAISAGASAATAGWWTGYAGLGFIPLWLSDLGWSWPQLYLLLAALSLMCGSVVFFSPDPPHTHQQDLKEILEENKRLLETTPFAARIRLLLWLCSPFLLAIWSVFGAPGLPQNLADAPLFVPIIVALELTLVIALLHRLNGLQHLGYATHSIPDRRLITLPAWLLSTLIAPFADFFQRNGLRLAMTLLLFIVVFKLGESFLGRMSILFYKEIGFSNTQIASYSKILTWVVTMAAAIPCGLLNAKLGLTKGLLISGIFMAASNLLFVVIAIVGPDTNWYMITVIVDGITAAWASIAFVSFISMLCSHTFSATQYALLASLGALGRSTLAAFSGQLVDALNGNWVIFFIITALMVIPGLILLGRISHHIKRLQSKDST